MIPVYETCNFGDGDLAGYFDITNQLDTVDKMYTASSNFIDASAVIQDDSAVFDALISQLDDYMKRPHTLNFTDSLLK